MIMADVFQILFIILGLLVTIVCYWLFFEAFTPRMVSRARSEYERHPVKLLFRGLLWGAPTLIAGIALVSAQPPPAKIAGFAILLSLLLLGLLGSAGLSRHIGQRLASPIDTEQPWRRVLRGGTVLSITFVLPFLGWFMILPLTLVSGIGAAVTALRRVDPADESVVAP